MRKTLLLLFFLQLPHLAFAGEYTFVGMRGEIYFMGDKSTVEKRHGPLDVSDIYDCMYSVSNNQLSVHINTVDYFIESYGPISKNPNQGKYKRITKREDGHFGIFFDTETGGIASSKVGIVLRDGKRVAEKEKFYLLNDKGMKDKTTLDNCLTIRLRGQRKYFPQGEYKKDEFVSKHKNLEKQILKRKTSWLFMGQSAKWICYSNLSYAEPGELKENSTWIMDRDTGWEKIYHWEREIGYEFTYPNVVLIHTKIRKAGDWQPPNNTGDYYIQLPGEEELRKIVMDPEAKHLWANAQSVFFQLGKDILRVDYLGGQKEPVKICEIEEPLFCMFEKDNILAALAEDDSKDKNNASAKRQEK